MFFGTFQNFKLRSISHQNVLHFGLLDDIFGLVIIIGGVNGNGNRPQHLHGNVKNNPIFRILRKNTYTSPFFTSRVCNPFAVWQTIAQNFFQVRISISSPFLKLRAVFCGNFLVFSSKSWSRFFIGIYGNFMNWIFSKIKQYIRMIPIKFSLLSLRFILNRFEDKFIDSVGILSV